MSSETDIRQAIASYIDPYLGQDYVSAGLVGGINLTNDQVVVEIKLGFAAEGVREKITQALVDAIKQATGLSATIDLDMSVIAHVVQQGVKRLPEIKNIIAVASGKGGVGKSTTAANLALALAVEGASVGLLDADIYGPSQTVMLGSAGQPETTDGKSMEPMRSHGIQSISLGNLVEPDAAIIWRGPMATQALMQLLNDTRWQGLDYLVVDLPPGTGDVQLTMAQKIPVSGTVIVTTPQDIALQDVRRSIAMFNKVDVPVLGVVENMSIHVCSACGNEDPIFGSGGGARISEEFGVALLGSLPLDITIREDVDRGVPTVARDPEGPLAMRYREIARRVGAGLAIKARDYSAKFPKIIIENS